MEEAKELFDTLQTLKQDDASGKSPQQRLIEYCMNVLGAIERFHVDFKDKSDRRDSKLSDSDRRSLAKAVFGFANSGGGVLIWGVENKSMGAKPITEVHTFVGLLLSLAPQVTDPSLQGIDGDWIPSDPRTGRDGFGLVYVVPGLNLWQ